MLDVIGIYGVTLVVGLEFNLLFITRVYHHELLDLPAN